MKDNKKINKAVNVLQESGVPFVLVRRDDVNGTHANRVDMRGMYPDVKACMISAMVRFGRVIMESGYDELTTARELQNISLQAVREQGRKGAGINAQRKIRQVPLRNDSRTLYQSALHA